ncbi:class I SAM-dependent methyltransferase [Actinacidiphila yeochonensis]|uniref:class I SAM-dependent methyltransferase n=1 Tax=Actinacidiphila yeochonensis TaxID=89050 RepID=UPI0005683A9B|nr:class I SAM-dependent methyltransferase [Actinacidiphila yeochonensis]
MDHRIRTVDDVLGLLDGLFAPAADRWTAAAGPWWDAFYADRSRGIPFFVRKPDENLASYLDRGLVPAGGRALDLGCGPGRNALYLVARGFRVDAVDLSPVAVAWAEERAAAAGVPRLPGARDTPSALGPSAAGLRLLCGDAFALPPSELDGPYDLVHDSGCFHHLPPHRRISYLALLDRVLAPGGHFALTCFTDGQTGSELPDRAFYERAGLEGGLAYSQADLRYVFADLDEVEQRVMRDETADSPYFGEPFLRTALFRKPGGAAAPVPGTR